MVDISDLYHVSLDCLLKEKPRPMEEDHRQHLSEHLLDRHLSSAQTCMIRKERFE